MDSLFLERIFVSPKPTNSVSEVQAYFHTPIWHGTIQLSYGIHECSFPTPILLPKTFISLQMQKKIVKYREYCYEEEKKKQELLIFKILLHLGPSRKIGFIEGPRRNMTPSLMLAVFVQSRRTLTATQHCVSKTKRSWVKAIHQRNANCSRRKSAISGSWFLKKD